MRVKLCAGHFGVFADGILLLSPPTQPGFVARLTIFNPDGSEAELSGNGAREAILYLRHRGWTDSDVFSIETAAGEIRPTITGPTTCRVDMGRAKLTSKDYPGGADDGRGEIGTPGRLWPFQHVSIGNPQCSMRVDSIDELDALDLPALGPFDRGQRAVPEPHERLLVRRAGAGPHPRAHLRARRRRDALLRHRRDRRRDRARAARAATRRVTVVLDGGELTVEVGEDLHVNLTGWAVPVFAGTLSDDFLKELHATE